MHCNWMLALHVIVERPGPYHSRYSTIELVRFEAEDLVQRHEAHRVAAAVAATSGLPLRAPPIEDRGGQGDSGWIRAQPVSAPHAYELAWEARWWTDDGESAHASGVEHVVATSGCDADVVLSRELKHRFPSRPLSIRIRGG